MRDGSNVADKERTHSQHDEHLLPFQRQAEQAFNQQTNGDGKRRELGRGANQQGHRGGCTLVDIRHPHVEGHSAKLEGQASNDKNNAKVQHLFVDAPGGDLLKDLGDF